MSVLPCQSCGYENDPSRVFCHNCGVRLERPQEMVEKVAQADQSAKARAAKLRKEGLGSQKKGFDWSDFFASCIASTIRLALLAALAAAVILMFRAPDGVPEPSVSDESQRLEYFRTAILSYSESPFPRTLVVPAQVAQSLVAREFDLQPHTGTAFVRAIPERIFANFGDNQFKIGVEMRLAGRLVYLTSTFKTARNAPLKEVAGSVGRLPVPTFLLPSWQWYDVLLNTNSELISALEKASAIEITPQEITIRWASPSA